MWEEEAMLFEDGDSLLTLVVEVFELGVISGYSFLVRWGGQKGYRPDRQAEKGTDPMCTSSTSLLGHARYWLKAHRHGASIG